MKWVVRIIQGLLVLAFLFSGGAKLAANPMQVAGFESYGYGIWFMYVVGLVEVLAAIGLLIGFWKSKVTLFSAGVLALTMIGAVFTHLYAGQGIGAAMPALVLLILNLFVLFGGLSIAKRQEEITSEG